MKNKISRKQQLLTNIERAKVLYPEYAEMFEDIRIEVSNNYPRFNSKSTWPVTCSVCGETREVRIGHLYRGFGLDMCYVCSHRFAIPIAQTVGYEARLAAAHTPEVHSKIAQTQWSRGSLNSDTCRKAALNGWQTRKSS